jgi:ABC-type polysaccharide/polyol phosphate export permease
MSEDAAIRRADPLPMRAMVPTKRRLRLRELVTSLPVAREVGLRDIKIKYKQAALGPLWLVLAPLGLLAAVTIAFSGVTDVQTGDVPYVLFALVGLCVWTFVQLNLMLAPNALVGNAQLVRRSAAPRLAFISATVLANFPPAMVMLVTTLIALAIGRGFPMQALLLPVMIVWLIVFTWTLVALLAAVSTRFRDIVSVVPLVVQAGIFVTPVGYSLEGAPANIKAVIELNPVSGLIEAWRWCLLDMPATGPAIPIALGWTLIILVTAWQVFGRLEVRFADFI